MWWDKDHPDALYVDRRIVPPGSIVQQTMWQIEPDVAADFTALPFDDDSFALVVFDPPHATISPESITGMKYGTITDLDEVIAGLRECYRVVIPSGFLVFKWAEAVFPVQKVLDRAEMTPMFGHRTAKSGKTIWCLFRKEGSLDG